MQKFPDSVIPTVVQTRFRTPQLPLRSIANFIVLTSLFAIAYSQSPLYTSNQNQYFLHGFASAGYGNLSRDWLAKTLDPTPIFSKLIELTALYLQQEITYYLYYALLMGIYLFSLSGMASTLFDLRNSRSKSMAFTVLFIAIHSAGLRFALSRWLGVNWTYVLEDGVADQRMLGPVFQPSAFGVFLALSLYLFLQRKPYRSLLAASIAATLHPTYLLSVAILAMAYALVDWIEGKRLSIPIKYGLAASLFVSPILAYVFTAFGNTSTEIASRAQEILAVVRIPHHVMINQWFDATVIAKLALVAAAIYLALRRHRFQAAATPRSPAWRLGLILLIVSLECSLLTLLQVITQSQALALLFPWRLSILIVPVSTTLILAYFVERIMDTQAAQPAHRKRLVRLLSTFILFMAVLVGGIRFWLDLGRKAAEPEQTLYSYVYTHNSRDDIYLIPVKMQDFRLETGAPIWVDFKSIPYKDIELLEWFRRLRLAEQFYDNADCDLLAKLAREEHLTHVVLPLNPSAAQCPAMEQVYRDNYYLLASIRPAD